MEEKVQSARFNWRKLGAIGITSITSWLFTYLSISVFQDYALVLFIWLPLMMGVMSTIIYGFSNTVSNSDLRGTSFSTLWVYFGGVFLFAMDGLICIIMAAPFAAILIYAGYHLGRAILKRANRNHTQTTLVLLIVSVPLLMAFEKKTHTTDEMQSVVTSIDINASPETVWKHVIRFPQLKEPDELIFRTGIAYPVNATIEGAGVGAVRHCNFSTGSFVEPITIWNEPQLLRFSVSTQPEPMKEISFYDVHPAHLDGFWVSKQGQFRLKRLPNGHTLLEGTTWYVNKIRPGFYWSLWSNYIVHKIHKRVLQHIREQSEIDHSHTNAAQ